MKRKAGHAEDVDQRLGQRIENHRRRGTREQDRGELPPPLEPDRIAEQQTYERLLRHAGQNERIRIELLPAHALEPRPEPKAGLETQEQHGEEEARPDSEE